MKIQITHDCAPFDEFGRPHQIKSGTILEGQPVFSGPFTISLNIGGLIMNFSRFSIKELTDSDVSFKVRTLDEVCGLPPGSFQKYLKEQEQENLELEQRRAIRIKNAKR